jgi:hypothetical protein
VIRVRNAASGTSYFLSKNRMRFVILLAVLTFLILQNSVHTLIEAVIGLLGFLPTSSSSAPSSS